MSKGWDSATIKKLKSLLGRGLSTSEIGKQLGMSKNAVVGKLNRLGWNAKASASPATAKKATASTKKVATKTPARKTVTVSKVNTKTKTATKKPETKTVAKKKTTVAPVKPKATPKQPKAAKETKSAKNLAMHQRIIQHSLEMANLKPNQCRWPIGDPDSENFHFCGKTVFTGKPYCYEHCRLAYQFTPPKKK